MNKYERCVAAIKDLRHALKGTALANSLFVKWHANMGPTIHPLAELQFEGETQHDFMVWEHYNRDKVDSLKLETKDRIAFLEHGELVVRILASHHFNLMVQPNWEWDHSSTNGRSSGKAKYVPLFGFFCSLRDEFVEPTDALAYLRRLCRVDDPRFDRQLHEILEDSGHDFGVFAARAGEYVTRPEGFFCQLKSQEAVDVLKEYFAGCTFKETLRGGKKSRVFQLEITA